jgi:hypothetical protein
MVRGLVATSLLASAFLVATAHAAPRPFDPFWKETRESTPTTPPGLERVVPERYRVFQVQLPLIRDRLARAPLEPADPRAGVEITLPLPDGRLVPFRVVESPVLSRELQWAHPDLRTYRAAGPAGYQGRIDLTPLGLRAIVSTPEGTAYVDPLVRGFTDTVTSYWGYDVPDMPFDCDVLESPAASAPHSEPSGATGDTLRTYRLVMLGTGEYTQYLGGVSQAMAEMTTCVNRIDLVYERDVAVHYELVQMLPYPDPATDPFPLGGDEQQALVDSVVGPANYDLAQLLEQGGSYPGHAGASYLPSVCWDGFKGQDWVSAGDVTANQVMIKVMAHEMGHPLGAHHVADASCQFDAESAYEPGSGTTIMGRTGKCGVDNVQLVGDLYFNGCSIEQMADTILTDSALTVPTCGGRTPTGNSLPTANAGPDCTIPTHTPFVLTGIGTDADPLDTLTYCWEEHDLALALGDTLNGALFRSRLPSLSPARYLPIVETVLADTASRWEKLPSVPRSMTFRLTVRDNHPGAGGVAWDEMTITVAGAPFAVTSPNGGETRMSGQPFNATWNVGGGSVASHVDILFSSDGGASWVPLATNTDNDGSELVTASLPHTSAQCRIKIAAVNNIFYDVSHADFTVLGDDVPTLPALVTATYADGRVKLAWNGDSRATLSRRAEAGAWSDLAELEPDGAGQLLYEDAQVRPSVTYGYRLGLEGGVFTAETRVTIPGPTFGLYSAAANPTSGGLAVRIALTSPEPARLDVLGVGGRRLLSREVGALGIGEHRVELGSTSLPPGLYWIQLTQGARRALIKTTVLR